MNGLSQPSSPPNWPRHIAIVMDGNGRWATARGLARTIGHEVGSDVATQIYQAARRMGIRYLTLYAFSVANWQRPDEEVRRLMELFANYARKQRHDLLERDIRFQVIGDLRPVPAATRLQLERTAKATRHCRSMVLSTAINYGARDDLLRAVQAMAGRVEAGELSATDIDEATLRRQMASSSLPDPDLLIRTGGEVRLSDFMLLECAYSELLFSDLMWPDFTAADLRSACVAFGKRLRRFGQIEREPEPAARDA